MKIVIQRVSQANVTVEKEIVGKIGYGYLLLVGIEEGDDKDIIDQMADKVVELRIMEDENRKMNLSIKDISGEILSRSQYTLLADCSHGRRPGFTRAARAEEARNLYLYFNDQLRKHDLPVETGIFQADMKVMLVNDGPVTIILDSREVCRKR